MVNHPSRKINSRSSLRKHTAIILPILLLYIYLLFFAAKSGSREEFLKRKNSENYHKLARSRNDWENVHHPIYNFSVYSAYSFSKNFPFSSPEVHVISGYRTFEEDLPVKCRFYFGNDNNSQEETSVVVPGHMEMMTGWDFRFAGNFIRCPMPIETDDINDTADHPMKKPSSVSILIGNITESTNRIPIHHQSLPSENIDDSEKNYEHQFSVCVPPLHEYNQVFHFLEWFEFYRMMGVTQFTFYNMSIGPELSCVMKNLQREQSIFHGVTINIDPWHQYPIQNFSIARYGHGISAATNDCLLRHKGISKYLVMADIDEFIMPRYETGLKKYDDLVKFLDSQNETAKFGEYVFKNGFFERNRGKDAQLMERCSSLRANTFEYYVCQELFMMQFVKREDFRSWGDRSKYIMRPERVNTAGYHAAAKMESLPGGHFDSGKVSEEVAFSRHYQYFNEGPNVVVDKVQREFGVKLARNVRGSIEYFMDRCGLTLMDIFKEF